MPADLEHLLLAVFQHQIDGALIGHGWVCGDGIWATARYVLKLLAVYHQTHESGRNAALIFYQLFETQHTQVLHRQEGEKQTEGNIKPHSYYQGSGMLTLMLTWCHMNDK